MQATRFRDKQSPFMRDVSLCLLLFGAATLSVSGVMMARWSLKYAAFGKFTVVGGSCAVLGIAVIIHALIKRFRKTGEGSIGIGRPLAGHRC